MAGTKTEEQLAIAIRRLREERNLSVRTLAALADFSPSFISQIETGQAFPSISSLEKIANALGVTLSKFFDSSSPKHSNIVRTGERPCFESGWSKATLEGLGAGRSGWFEPVLISIQPGGMSGKRVHSSVREEFAFVVKGELVLTLNDEDSVLEQGDAVTIPTNTPRRWRNDATTSGQILLVSLRP